MPKNVFTQIGRRFRAARGRLSRVKLAELSGVSKSTIHRIEQGEAFKVIAGLALARGLGRPLSDFLGDQQPGVPEELLTIWREVPPAWRPLLITFGRSLAEFARSASPAAQPRLPAKE